MSQAPNIGLGTPEATALLNSDSYNALPTAERRRVLRISFEVMQQPMFALLIVGRGVYSLLGDCMEAIFLLAFASLSISITIVQETRSERVLEALHILTLASAASFWWEVS